MPSLAMSYGVVPEGWRPRPTDGRNVSKCRGCGKEFLDDFPFGGLIQSPCCPSSEMNRCTRPTMPDDRATDPMARLGWKSEDKR